MSNEVIKMRLTDKPFDLIGKGIKTIEVRLFDEKRRKVMLGDRIVFSRMSGSDDKIIATVTALHIYRTFFELYSSEIGYKCGIDGISVEQAVNAIYEYYTPNDEEKYGVLGIEISADV